MDIKGKIVSYTDKSGVSKAGKEYKKAELVIKNNEGYKDKEVHYCFTLFGKAMERFSNKVGDKVNVLFFIESRQWKDRWFTELIAFAVESVLDDTRKHLESIRGARGSAIDSGWTSLQEGQGSGSFKQSYLHGS